MARAGGAVRCRAGGERGGVRPVQSSSLGREELVVDRLAEKRVAERVAAAEDGVAGRADQLRRDRLVERRRQAPRRRSPAPPGAGRGRRCRRPPDAASRTRPAGSDREPTRPSRTSRSRAGSVACSADPAARSSSAKNGLPSDRRAMRSTSDGGTGAPWMAASWSASSARSNRSRSTCSTRGRRASSASQGRSGCRRWSSSERYVTISRTRSSRRRRRHERQQVARRPVRPVDVLHDERHGPPLAETLEQDDEAVEQAGLGPFRRRVRPEIAMVLEELRDEPGQLSRGRIDQFVEDRPVR